MPARHGSKPAPPDQRPYRAMHAPGDELTSVVTDAVGRRFRQVARQIGWLGQSGAFYALDEDVKPSDHEPGSFSPMFVIAHVDEIEVEDPAPSEGSAAEAFANARRILHHAELETNLAFMERLEKLADSWIQMAGMLTERERI